MIKVAEKAKDEVTKLMKHDGFDPSAHFIRVGVKSGGCSGLSYELKFDKTHLVMIRFLKITELKLQLIKKAFFI